MKDHICELHFEEKYISRNYEEKLSDGSLFILKRTINGLKHDAVPTIFPVSSNQDKSNLTHKSSSENMAVDERITEAWSDIESDAIDPLCVDTLAFDFNYLIANLHVIQKPASSWTVSYISEADSKYVMCAMWRNYLAEKKIVIDSSLNIKVRKFLLFFQVLFSSIKLLLISLFIFNA